MSIPLTHKPEFEPAGSTGLDLCPQQVPGRGVDLLRMMRVVGEGVGAGEHLKCHRLDLQGHRLTLDCNRQ